MRRELTTQSPRSPQRCPNTDIHIYEAQCTDIDLHLLCAALKTVSRLCLSYSQADVSLTGVKEDMEAAKLQLEAYSVTLTDLISKIGKSLPYRSFPLLLLFGLLVHKKPHKSSLYLKCQITKELCAFERLI